MGDFVTTLTPGLPTRTSVMCTGGAEGADMAFTRAALYESDHVVRIVTFTGNRPQLPPPEYQDANKIFQSIGRLSTHLCTDAELLAALPHVKEAALIRSRHLPGSPWGLRYIQRDFYQVKGADFVYAVGIRKRTATLHQQVTYDNVDIDGGTGYTCQMFLSRFLGAHRAAADSEWRHHDTVVPVPLYFFDQEEARWERPVASLKIGKPLEWEILSGTPPGPLTPELRGQTYAGIGTRALNSTGKKAIARLYQQH